MSAFDRSERFQVELPQILTEIAAPRVPDYVDDLLARTAVTRQRPRWTFLERWLPMGVIARRPLYVPRVPWRTLVTVALLIALVALAVVVAGSRQQRVPPPFGPARNGAIAFGSDGDVYLRDLAGSESRLAISGPTDDFAATFTRDGTKILFLRRTSGTAGSAGERIQLLAANPDGSGTVPVTDSLLAPDWWDIAPDDASVVVAAGDPDVGQFLYTASIRTPGPMRQIIVGEPTMIFNVPNFLGPTGTEITFRGSLRTPDGRKSGIFAVKPDGTGLRPLTKTDGGDGDYLFPQPSPDGKFIAYTTWDGDAQLNRTHILELATGADRLVSDRNRSQGFASFSPDSERIIFVQYRSDRRQIMVRPAAGGPPLALGPNYPDVRGFDTTGTFSPDGKSVIVVDGFSKETRLIDVAAGGNGRLLDWSAGNFTGWQRLAP